jgi:hypothetical protein
MVSKTTQYRLASQFLGTQAVLQAAIDACKANYPMGVLPTFAFKEGYDCVVAKHVVQAAGASFLHLVTYEQGAGSAVVALLATADVGEQPAPNDKEYIQSQLFLLCSENHVLWTSHNAPVRDSGAALLVNKLIGAFGKFPEDPYYSLDAVLDDSKLEGLIKDGIERIELKAGTFRETLEYVQQGGHLKSPTFISILASAVGLETKEVSLNAADNIGVQVALVPGTKWKFAEVKRVMSDVAKTVVDEYDSGFVIVTKSNLRITQDSITIKDKFNASGNKQIIDVKQVESALRDALAKFREIGVIE